MSQLRYHEGNPHDRVTRIFSLLQSADAEVRSYITALEADLKKWRADLARTDLVNDEIKRSFNQAAEAFNHVEAALKAANIYQRGPSARVREQGLENARRAVELLSGVQAATDIDNQGEAAARRFLGGLLR